MLCNNRESVGERTLEKSNYQMFIVQNLISNQNTEGVLHYSHWIYRRLSSNVEKTADNLVSVQFADNESAKVIFLGFYLATLRASHTIVIYYYNVMIIFTARVLLIDKWLSLQLCN